MTRLSTSIAAGAFLSLTAVVSAFGQAPVPVPVPTPTPVYGSYPVAVPTPVPTPVQILQAPVLQTPATLTIPQGTYISVELADQLSSDRSRADDEFTAILHQPIVVDGWVVARTGQPVMGRVVSVQKSGQVKGKSNIGIELGELVLVDGQQIPIQTQTIKDQANASTGRDFAAIALTTGFGALIGAGVGGGSGAAIGAGIGAGAGTAGVLATPGDAAKIHSERVLAFRLDDEVTITTARSQHAFLPATPADYAVPVQAPGPPVLQQPVYYAAPAPTVVAVPYGYPRYYRRY